MMFIALFAATGGSWGMSTSLRHGFWRNTEQKLTESEKRKVIFTEIKDKLVDLINKIQSENSILLKIENSKNYLNQDYSIISSRKETSFIEKRPDKGYYISGYEETYLPDINSSLQNMGNEMNGDDVKSFQFLVTLLILSIDSFNSNKYKEEAKSLLNIIKKHSIKYPTLDYLFGTNDLKISLEYLIQRLFTNKELEEALRPMTDIITKKQEMMRYYDSRGPWS